MTTRQKVVAIGDETTQKALSWQDAIIEDEATTGAWRMENAALADAATIMSLFFNEDWVFVTCDLLASEFASPWPRIMREEVVSGRAVRKPAEGHPLQALLDDPTIYGGGYEFWYRAAIFDALLGNTFLWHMKANNKFLIIPSHEAQIKFDDRTRMPTHVLWTGGEEQSAGMRAGVSFPMAEICHVQRPNPASLWWGMSPFVPGRRSILFNRYSQEFLNSFFDKGATPQMVVETEIGNNPEAIKTLAKSFELVNAGRKNARRPLVLPKGAKVTQVNMTIADTQLKEFVAQNREVILSLLRVPKHAVGLQTSGSLGSEEHKTALRFMWGSTIKPMLKRFATSLTKFFQANGMLVPGFVVDFDTSEIEVANEDAQKKADLAKGLSPFFTVNEIRRTVWESEPIYGGDIIPGVLPPSAPAPLPAFELSAPTDAQETKATTTDAPERYAHIDFTPPTGVREAAKRGLELREKYGRGGTEVGVARAVQLSGGEVISPDTARRMYRFFIRHEGNQAGGEDDAGFIAWLLWGGDPGKAWAGKLWRQMEAADDEDDNKSFGRRRDKFSALDVLLSSEGLKAIDDAMNHEENETAKTIEKLAQDTLISQLKTALRVASEQLKQKAKINKRELAAEILAEIMEDQARFKRDYSNALSNTTTIGYNSQLAMVFRPQDREALEALRAETERGRKAILARRGLEAFAAISKTTTQNIVNTVADGVERGESLTSIAQSISENYAQISAGRARTIARTETLTAVSIGQQSAMQSAMRVMPDAKKVWLTSNDERVRDAHEAMHGDVVGLEEKFDVDGVAMDVPRDPDVQDRPDLVINCRCRAVIVAPEDVGSI